MGEFVFRLVDGEEVRGRVVAAMPYLTHQMTLLVLDGAGRCHALTLGRLEWHHNPVTAVAPAEGGAFGVSDMLGGVP